MEIIILIFSLGVILFGAEVFTNGIEWLGKKLNLSEGTVGSVLAAVGTALPETMIPVIAILFGTGDEASHIGIGAILGAPFMLATLALGVVGIAGTLFKVGGKRREHMLINEGVMRRDLLFFLIVFSIAIAAAFMPPGFKQVIVFGLVAAYVVYVYLTVKDDTKADTDAELHPLKFAKKSTDPSLGIILLQAAFALGIIVLGAHLFVDSIKYLSQVIGLPAFVLSIIIAPVATELPEKFNSLIWIRKGKDTLALGNITGAMVFQSSLIPALGIAFTPWELSTLAVVSAVLALLSAAIVYGTLYFKRSISPKTLIGVSSLYFVFIIAVVLTGGGH
ncbi:sodium:calcium antiporter [Metallumcola ferriviriculae]|uniref:Sodium:calcium antiporter n=1 Tax=Metallumcola ferriviriculae TaxID=3039180 RepID=A0AAU0UMF8_9FIRM|nr:sodium:calcium antiporter [Desulfitibacteraceae bacterium MK1]